MSHFLFTKEQEVRILTGIEKAALSKNPWKGITDLYESEFPEIWRKCYPRVYPDMADYYSTKTLAMDVFTAVLKRGSDFFSGASELYEFWVASLLAVFRFPIFFLSPGLATAIKHTKPPLELAWHDMKLPFEAAVFMLPKGLVVHPTHGDCAYVAYARLPRGKVYESPLLPGHRFGSGNGTLTLTMGCPARPLVFHYNFADNLIPVIHLQDLDTSMDGAIDDTIPFLADGSGLNDEDKQVVNRAAHYMFSAILLMMNHPELVESGGRTGKRNKRGMEFWTPNILGARYRIQHARGNATGEGTSPRAHWRRGHWRNQVHGPGFSLRKDLWIEPVFVNPD